MRRVVYALFSLALGCGRPAAKAEPPVNRAAGDGSGAAAGAGAVAGAGAAASATSASSLDTGYPPDDLLYFVGFRPEDVLALRVDSQYVSWKDTNGLIFRALKDGSGQPTKIADCHSCAIKDFEADADYVYYYHSYAQKLSRQRIADGKVDEVNLPWAASNYGLALGNDYIYVAMPGCAAITRVSKTTLKAETMTIDGVEPPGQGYTRVLEHDQGLLCGGPKQIFEIDAWGRPAHALASATVLHDLTLYQGTVYWKEFDEATPQPNGRIGFVPLAGGTARRVPQPYSAGFGNLGIVPSIEHLFFAGDASILGFDLQLNAFDAFDPFAKPKVGYLPSPAGFAVDDDYLYVAIDGVRVNPDTNQPDTAYWIRRVSPARVLDVGWK